MPIAVVREPPNLNDPKVKQEEVLRLLCISPSRIRPPAIPLFMKLGFKPGSKTKATMDYFTNLSDKEKMELLDGRHPITWAWEEFKSRGPKVLTIVER